MFFHRIERLSNSNKMKDKIEERLEGPHYTVVPLVKPDSAVGKLLMDRKQSADLSEYSGEKINIFYTDEEIKAEFHRFMRCIFSEVRNLSGKDIKEPGLLIFFPQKSQLISIKVLGEDNPRKFLAIMYQLIDALESENSLENINRLTFEVDITPIDDPDAHLIKELHSYVIKFFV
jgi:hypothetical protein